jgi:kinetochor protein Mis14/NSL1
MAPQYISRTFTLASPSLSINGLPVDLARLLSGAPSDADAPLQPEVIYEAFDARKRARVEELTREEEDLLRDIAALKKSVPGAAAASWSEGFKKGVRDDEEALEKSKAEARRDERDGLKVDALERGLWSDVFWWDVR